MNWEELIKQENKKEYYQELMRFVEEEYSIHEVFPAKENIYKALDVTPLENVKVVILGQDPYHGVGQAHGLSFSVNKGVKLPPSLRNIYKEFEEDLGITAPVDGFLEEWAKEGVLLLNTVLTVRKGEPNSHKNQGWELFTDEVIKTVNDKCDSVVFILWGGPAQKKKKMLDDNKHLIIEVPHPSPLSSYRGFFGSKPFSKVNTYLESKNKSKINWDKIIN